MTLNELKNVLYLCYSKDLCYFKVKDNWTIQNKCLGMCAITSLIVNDYFHGEIGKLYVEGVSHYFNV